MADEVNKRRELKKLWAFGKNNSTVHWNWLVGRTAGKIRALTEGKRWSDIVGIDCTGFKKFEADLIRLPHKEIPDCAVLQADFSFEWIEILLQCGPDTPDMEIIAHAAK